jgi:hypothetical protein
MTDEKLRDLINEWLPLQKRLEETDAELAHPGVRRQTDLPRRNHHPERTVARPVGAPTFTAGARTGAQRRARSNQRPLL